MKIAVLLIAGLLSACAAPPKLAPSDQPQWSGRLSIKVDSDPVEQTRAAFTLVGTASAGELNLFNPLGNKAAQVAWQANWASIATGAKNQDIKTFPSLAAALRQITQADIPIASLFDWLQGKQDKVLEAAIGWDVDLTRAADGRINATRIDPAPRIELRVVLEK